MKRKGKIVRRRQVAFLLVGMGLASIEPNIAIAARCHLADATYGNIGTDYELRFGPEAVSRLQAFSLHMTSKSQKVDLTGDISWNNGYAVPNFTISLGEKEIHGYQIYGLETNKSGRISDIRFVGLDDPAPKSILLPGLSHALFWALDFRSTGVKLPEDMFYLARCK